MGFNRIRVAVLLFVYFGFRYCCLKVIGWTSHGCKQDVATIGNVTWLRFRISSYYRVVTREYLQSASWPAGTRTTASPSSRVRPTSCYGQTLRSSQPGDDERRVDRLRLRRRRNCVSSRGGSSGSQRPSARRPSAAGGPPPPGRTRAPCLRDSTRRVQGAHCK